MEGKLENLFGLKFVKIVYFKLQLRTTSYVNFEKSIKHLI